MSDGLCYGSETIFNAYPRKTLFFEITGLSNLKVPNSTSKMLLLTVLTVLTVFVFFTLLVVGVEKLRTGIIKKKDKINSL